MRNEGEGKGERCLLRQPDGQRYSWHCSPIDRGHRLRAKAGELFEAALLVTDHKSLPLAMRFGFRHGCLRSLQFAVLQGGNNADPVSFMTSEPFGGFAHHLEW